MSVYTTQVRYICEMAAGVTESAGWDDVPDIIAAAAPSIFGDFPIFDEAYRATLEYKILAHYYQWEIGAETVGQWKMWLNTKMREIMPKYNILYNALNAALAQDNIFDDTNITTTRDSSGDTVGTSSAVTDRASSGATESENNSADNLSTSNRSDSDHINKYSDTPQGGIANLQAGTYLTNASEDTDSGSTVGSSARATAATGRESDERSELERRADTNAVSNTENYIEKIVGKRGGKNFMLELKEAYDAFVNIDLSIIHDLQELFMGVW